MIEPVPSGVSSVVAVSVAGVDVAVFAAFLLLLAGVVASVIPVAPAPLLSLSGVILYWWSTGYAKPGAILLVALAVVCLLALVSDLFGDVVTARLGGASTRTAVAAGIVGFALLFVAGPLGVLAGSAVTVFVLEYRRHRDASEGVKATAVYVLGFFASALVQALLLLSVLAAMVVVAIF